MDQGEHRAPEAVARCSKSRGKRKEGPRNQELWAVGRSRWLAVRFCHSHGSRGFYTSFGVDPSHTLPSPQSVLLTQGISERSSWDMQPAGSSRGASQRFLDRTLRAVSTSVRSLAFAPPALNKLFYETETDSQGLPWWCSGWDSTLPMQGAWVPSLVGELDPMCCN